MRQITIDDAIDICEGRHGGAETSVEAHPHVSKEYDRQIIGRRIDLAGRYGMTLDELCIVLGRTPNAISGRLTELRIMGLIHISDKKRRTRTGAMARVYVVKEWA